MSRSNLVMVPILLLAVALMVPMNVRSANSQLVGLVCLSTSNSGSCPSPPVTFSSQVGGQISVSVLVQGSDSLYGFDITLLANHNVLKPVSASLAGGLLSGGSIIGECFGGVLEAGYGCLGNQTADTLEFAAIGPLQYFTHAPTSGLLFTATYNVTSSIATPISFQIGCHPSSVIGTSTCVNFGNGTPYPPPETFQAASFIPPDFTISANPSNLGTVTTCFKGCPTTTITVTGVGSFSGTVSLSASAPSGVKASFNPASVNVPQGSYATSTLTLTFTCPLGSPPVTVESQQGSLNHNTYITWNSVKC